MTHALSDVVLIVNIIGIILMYLSNKESNLTAINCYLFTIYALNTMNSTE